MYLHRVADAAKKHKLVEDLNNYYDEVHDTKHKTNVLPTKLIFCNTQLKEKPNPKKTQADAKVDSANHGLHLQ